MEKKKQFFIYYNNGNVEISNSINITLLHMIEMEVIKLIYDCSENKIWRINKEGIAKESKVPEVSGL